MDKMINVDYLGRYTDCHFCSVRAKGTSCIVLKDFYNAENPDKAEKLCEGCPFYKTDEEFWKGFRSRGEMTENEKTA